MFVPRANNEIGGWSGPIKMAKEVIAIHKHGKLGFQGGEVVTTTQFNGQLGSRIKLNDYVVAHCVISIENCWIIFIIVPIGLVIVDLCEEKEKRTKIGPFSLGREEI